jgi:hypothetical protein
MDSAARHDDVGKKDGDIELSPFQKTGTPDHNQNTMSYTRFASKTNSNGSKRTRRCAPACSPIVDPHAVYSLAGLQKALHLRRNSLPREIREGRLRAIKRCGRWWIVGRDVLAWLGGD